ncbi:MFS transporter [Patescibacteria group bacterium]
MFKKKEYITIFIILVTEVLGFSLILPFLPFYVQKLGGTPLTVGLILTTFSLLQFVSAPIMGKLSDTYGRKPLLMLSQLSTFISFIMLGFSKSIPMIFLSRAMDGLLGSNATIAQSYLSDISSKEDRSKAYGISGAAFGFGFLIGPAIGGSLAKISFALPAFIAAFFSLASIIMTKFLLKETVTNSHKKEFNIKKAIKDINPINIISNFSNKTLAIPLMLMFAYALSHTIYVSNFSLFGERQFGLTVDKVGYVLAYIGLVSVILRGFLLEKIIDKFNEKNIIKFGYISNMIGLAFFGFSHSIPMLFLAVTFFSIGSGLLRPTLMAEISRSADENRQGEIMGVSNSLGSIAQIIGPITGGYALTYISASSLPLMAVLISLIGFTTYSRFKKSTN